MPNDFEKPDFDAAIPYVLEHEGGWSDDPADPGGATRWGISLRFLTDLGLDLNHDGTIDARDVANLTRIEAKALYRAHFWDRYQYGSLATQIVAEKVLDISVNVGPSRAHKILQRACRAVGAGGILEDGLIGPATWSAATAADQWALRVALRSEVAGFYRILAVENRTLAKFLTGWLRRAYW